MNIFATSKHPRSCARHLDDKRLNKMILETTQIICTILHRRFPGMPIAYKVSHDSHPITNWADDRDNARWLYALGLAYGDEIIYRTGRKHSSHLVLEGLDLNFGKFLKGKYEVERFHNGARHMGLGIDYTHIEDVHKAYRLYLNHRWPGDKRAPKWTKRRRPTWCTL